MLRQTPDLLPFLKMEEDGIIRTKKGFMDILQIKTTDLQSMNPQELQVYVMSQSAFLRSYTDSFKEVILNFPANCSVQREYWLKKREGVTDPIRLNFINRKLYEFDFLEKQRTNREFFIFVFSKSIDSLKSNIDLMKRLLAHSFPLKKIEEDKKRDVLLLLNNQNTKLLKQGKRGKK